MDTLVLETTHFVTLEALYCVTISYHILSSN